MTRANLEETFAYRKHVTDSSLEPPDTIQLEVTRRCNLRCLFCPLTVEEQYRPSDSRDLTLEDVRRLAPLFEAASSIELTGFGEIFMHPNLMELLRTFRQYDLAIYATTNGQLVSPEISNLLVRERLLDVLTFSIDAADPAMYRELRGADWDRLHENIQALKNAKESQNSVLPRLWFSFLAMRKNIDQLPDFVTMAARSGAERVILQHLFENRHYPDQNCFRDESQLTAALQGASEASRATGVSLDMRNLSSSTEGALPAESELPDRKEETRKAGMLIKACPLPWSHTFIQADGTVSACAMVWQSLNLGSLTKESFFQIWRGEQYAQLRRRMLSIDFPEPCFACRYYGWRKPVPLDELKSRIEMKEEISPQLGEGWHPPDVDAWGRSARWTRKKATVFLKNDQSRMLKIDAITHPSAPHMEGAIKVTQWSLDGEKPLMPPARFQIDSHDFWGEPVRLPLPPFEGELLQVDIALDRTWNPKDGMDKGYRHVGLLVYEIALDTKDHEIKSRMESSQLGQGWLASETVRGHSVRWFGLEATAFIRTEKEPLTIHAMLPAGLEGRKIKAYLDGEKLGECSLPGDGTLHRLVFPAPPFSPKVVILQLRSSQALPAPDDETKHPRLFGALIGSIGFEPEE